ncbi:MAG: hypothetical protein Q8T09_00620 [Candidatus Melainabacteria bacterium]|nr:hypothetical protein [Candidatus Melainabacteria bacterium]
MQNLHLIASALIVSAQNGQVFVCSESLIGAPTDIQEKAKGHQFAAILAFRTRSPTHLDIVSSWGQLQLTNNPGGGRAAPAGWKPAHRQPLGVSGVLGGGWVASRRSLPVLFPQQIKGPRRHNKRKAARGSFSKL